MLIGKVNSPPSSSPLDISSPTHRRERQADKSPAFTGALGRCDQFEFGIRHAGMLREPSNRLMTKCVRRGRNSGFTGIVLNDLLDGPSSEFRVPTSLEQPAIVWMRGDLGSLCRDKSFPE